MTQQARDPYPGLRSFEGDEADIFFGRDDCIDGMLDRLRETRFLAVLGSSGTGKSSLVKTGLLSALNMGLIIDAGSRWRVIEFKPGRSPLHNLARCLLQSEQQEPGSETRPADIEGLRARFVRRPAELIEWSRKNLTDRENLLLIVDQFEELFRYQAYGSQEEAEAFVALLLESAQAWDDPLYVAITMRSEYLGPCALIEGLAETISAGMFLVPRMTRDQCQTAIEGPARVYGGEVDAALVVRLLNDLARLSPWEDGGGDADQLDRLARRADQLPLLQHALNRMWLAAAERTDGSIRLTLDDYENIGGLRHALDGQADKIFKDFDNRHQLVTETVFRALTEGTTIADAKRRPARFKNLVRICGSEEYERLLRAGRGEEFESVVRDVVETFSAPGCELLRLEPGPHIDSDTDIDITHESVIRQWNTLSSWIEDEGAAARRWRRLRDDAEQYKKGGEVLRGLQLAEVDAWWKRKQPNEAWAQLYDDDYVAVKNYVDASKRAHKRRVSLVGVGAAIVLAAMAGIVYLVVWGAENASEAKIFQQFKQPVKVLAESVANGKNLSINSSNFLLSILPTFGILFPDNKAFARTQMYVLASLAEQERKLIKMSGQFLSATASDHAEEHRKAALRLAEEIAKQEWNLNTLRVDYSTLKDLADAFDKDGEHERAAEVLDKATVGFRSFEKTADEAWKWHVSSDIVASLFSQGDALENAKKWDDAIRVYQDGLMELSDFEKWPTPSLPENLDWPLRSRVSFHNRIGLALWRKAAASEPAEADRLRQQALDEYRLAVSTLTNAFPANFDQQLDLIRHDQNGWLAALDRPVQPADENGRQKREDVIFRDDKRSQTVRLAGLYDELGFIYRNTGRPLEALASYGLEYQARYDLVGGDEAKAAAAGYDNETAKRNLVRVLLAIGRIERNQNPKSPGTARLFKSCVDVLTDQVEETESESTLSDCYAELASASGDAGGQPDSAHKSDKRGRFFHAEADAHTRFDRVFDDPDDLRRVASVLEQLAIEGRVLEQADRYADKRRLKLMQAFEEKRDDANQDTLANAWAEGSWSKLLNRRPELAERYARVALSLKQENPLDPNSETGKIGAVNLAHALLFEGRAEEAQQIYTAVKDLKRDDEHTLGNDIRDDFATLRTLGFTHPGMCAVGKLVGDQAYSGADCAAAVEGRSGKAG